MVTIRLEQAGDADAVREVHRSAFPSAAEARLVDRLRDGGKAVLSLVAEVDDRVVGHVLFSPVSIATPSARCWGLGLAPVGVRPTHQRRGIGSSLIREGLAVCRREGRAFVVVLGNPAYYLRFGFQRASAVGLRNEFGADETFMVLELQPGAVPAGGGLAQYGPEFAEWTR